MTQTEGQAFISFTRRRKNYIAARLRDLVDAIPTQVHGVVMATEGFPVNHLASGTYHHLKSSAPPQVIPENLVWWTSFHRTDNPSFHVMWWDAAGAAALSDGASAGSGQSSPCCFTLHSPTPAQSETDEEITLNVMRIVSKPAVSQPTLDSKELPVPPCDVISQVMFMKQMDIFQLHGSFSLSQVYVTRYFQTQNLRYMYDDVVVRCGLLRKISCIR